MDILLFFFICSLFVVSWIGGGNSGHERSDDGWRSSQYLCCHCLCCLAPMDIVCRKMVFYLRYTSVRLSWHWKCLVKAIYKCVWSCIKNGQDNWIIESVTKTVGGGIDESVGTTAVDESDGGFGQSKCVRESSNHTQTMKKVKCIKWLNDNIKLVSFSSISCFFAIHT